MPDAINFETNGTCILGADGLTNIQANYQTVSGGYLQIKTSGASHRTYYYKYQLGTYVMVLSQYGMDDLYYVRCPEPPHPKYEDILGTFAAHNELGDTVGDMLADHTFHDHLHDLDNENRVYYDFFISGTCTYSNGVITYWPTNSNATEHDRYFRDFIVKRDEKGLWQIDMFHDSILCETAASNLDLPPPPRGYKLVH